jgi:exo-1,4-beta-D-glucosaminidase
MSRPPAWLVAVTAVVALAVAPVTAFTFRSADPDGGGAAQGGPAEGKRPAGRTVLPARAGSVTAVGGWHLQSSAAVPATGEQVSRVDYPAAGWLPVPARSTVLAGLLANRRYGDVDLFHSTNLRDKVDPRDFAVPWWYRETILVEDRAPSALTTRLRLAGTISRADVWLNGTQVVAAKDLAGAHNARDVDVTAHLRPGRNALAVKVYPADPRKDLVIGWIDWNPYPPDNNMGIWQDVTLHRSGAVELTGPRVQSELELPGMRTADLTVKAEVRNNRTSPTTALVAGRIGPVGFARPVRLAPGEQRTVAFSPADTPQLRLTDPRVWWPAGLGGQPLYELKLAARVGPEVADTAATSFGIRDVRSSLDAHGYRQFSVNGRPLLLRGGGWASDMFLRPDRRRLEDQLRLTRDAGLNMIRPEGKLEHEEFYRLADRYGIVLLPGWECCNKWEGYGGWDGEDTWTDEDYRVAGESMAATAERLRNHPSVIAFLVGSDFAPTARVERTYLDALRAADWPNPVLSSASRRGSPVLGSSGTKMDGPYDWVPPNYWYGERRGAAYGFASELSAGPDVPELDSLRRMLAPAELEQLWREPDARHYHAARPGSQFEKLSLYNRALAGRYGAPRDLADYVRKAQLLSYEATRAQFEAYGKRMDATDRSRTTGLVYWMLNNAWPSLTWHLYDHYLATGGGYFGARKANLPLHVQYSYDDRSVVLVNNRRDRSAAVTVTARVYNLDGTEKFAQAVPAVTAPGLGTAKVLTLSEPAGVSRTYLVKLTATDAAGREVDRNVYWLSTQPDVLDWSRSSWYHTPVTTYADLTGLAGLAQAPVRVNATTRRHGDARTTTVTLRHAGGSAAPAFFVAATLRAADGRPVLPVAWSDNYTSLWPGESVTLTATYRHRDAGGGPAAVEVSGVNVPPQRVGAG